MIYVADTDGVWEYKAFEKKLFKTPLEVLRNEGNGVGAGSWRGDVYYPAIGQALYKYEIGVSAAVSEIGPRNDGGLPAAYAACEIVNIVPWERGLFVVMNAVAHNEDDGVYESQQRVASLTELVRPNDTYLSIILSYERGGWRVAWTEEPAQLADYDVRPVVHDAFVAQARLWWALGTQLYYMELDQNPPEAQRWRRERYQETGRTVTPWYNAGVSDARKVGLAMLAEYEGIQHPAAIGQDEERGSIDLSIGYDYAEAFYPIQMEPDAEEPLLYGPAEFGGGAGKSFRTVRFEIDTALGTYPGADFVSPDVRELTFEYYKRMGIRQRYEYTVTFDLEMPYGGSVGRGAAVGTDEDHRVGAALQVVLPWRGWLAHRLGATARRAAHGAHGAVRRTVECDADPGGDIDGHAADVQAARDSAAAAGDVHGQLARVRVLARVEEAGIRGRGGLHLPVLAAWRAARARGDRRGLPVLAASEPGDQRQRRLLPLREGRGF